MDCKINRLSLATAPDHRSALFAGGETATLNWPAIHLGEMRVATVAGRKTIEGYAAVWDSLSLDLGGFVESIEPGAFVEALQPSREILALLHHDTRMILGRRSAGTLRFREDGKGLHFIINPPDTTVGRDAIENVRRGDIKGASFRMSDVRDSWSKTDDGRRHRRLLRIGTLMEVTLTPVPAYPATIVRLAGENLADAGPPQRSDARAGERREWLRRMEQAQHRARRIRLAVAMGATND